MTPRPRLLLTLLGTFHARLDLGRALPLPSRKGQALLAYLALSAGRRHGRDALCALLWPDSAADQARASLRQALAVTRRALGSAARPSLVTHPEHVAIDPDQVEVDATAFERLAAEADVASLERAARLYGGDLLAGLRIDEAPFEEWLRTERERLRELALDVNARVLAAHGKAGQTEPAIQAALRLLALDPLQEPAHRALMRLYAGQGRRGAALKQYQLCVDALQRELGAEPEGETRVLYQKLLRAPGDGARPDDTARPRRPRPAAPATSAPELPAARTPLFGREADLAVVRERLERAIQGEGQVVIVGGEAGIGKTRLVGALVTDALSRGCRVLLGHCHESDSILPFAPWVDALRSGQLGADEASLADLHPARRAELARLLPEAGQPGLPPTSDGPLALFESVAELLERAAAHEPIVVVLEDAHWADEMSLRLLAFVGRRVSSQPILLAVTARAEDLADARLAEHTLAELARAPRATSVQLEPLPRADIARIVRALVRAGSDGPALEERIWAMSEGSPLVAVEAMLAMPAEPRGDPAGPVPGDLSLPERVRELIARRIDRLGERVQTATAVAAVIGRRFDFALLRAATGMDDEQAAGAVEEMVRRHVLRTVGSQLEFTHDRVRDVAYGRLLPPRRRLLHAAVAEALARAGAARGLEAPGDHEQIEQLAHHAVRGELWDQAVEHLRRAGDRAAARSALQPARAALEQALAILGTLPESRAALEQAFEIRLALRPVLVQLGELAKALRVLREAEVLADRLDDEARRGQVCAFLTNIHSRLDDPAAAIASGTRALEIAGRRGDLRLRIVATTYLEQAHYYRGEYARVIELARDNLAALRPEWSHEFFGGSQPPAVNDRFRLIASLAHLGRFAEAAGHEAEAIRLAEETRHAYTVAVAYHAAATRRTIQGDWATAHDLIERQLAALREGNVGGELPSALANSARVLASLGDAGEARRRRIETERLLAAHPGRGRAGAGWIHHALARACVVLGELDDAERLAGLAMAAASTRTDFVPGTLHLLGDIASHPHQLDAANAHRRYDEALVLAERRGMRPLVAHCHLSLGRLCARTDRRAQATRHLETAAAMYHDLDMPGWREEAVAVSSGLA